MKQPRSEPLDGAEGTRWLRERDRQRVLQRAFSTACRYHRKHRDRGDQLHATGEEKVRGQQPLHYLGVPSCSLLLASCWSCPACTSLTHSQPFLADGPIRGSLTTCLSRRACTYVRSGRSVRVPDQLRRRSRDLGRRHRRRPPRPRAVAARRVVPDRSAALKSSIGIKTSESVSPATRTLRSSINSAAWPGACA